MAKQTVSEMQTNFSRYRLMAQHSDETINTIHQKIEERMKTALERAEAAQKIEPNLNEKDATSSLAQRQKYTAAANSINSIIIELIAAQGWFSQQLNSIDPATERLEEESRVSERQQQILKEMEIYLQSEAVAPYLQAEDNHAWIDPSSEALREATTIDYSLSKKVHKINELKTELAGINVAIQSKTISPDIEDAVLWRKSDLEQYEEKINTIATRYSTLQTEISDLLSDLKELGEKVEKEWLEILDQDNKNIRELQALPPYGNTFMADLTDGTPIRGEGKQGIKEQIEAFTDLHKEKEKQITSLQKQISKELAFRVEGRITLLNEWLEITSLFNPLKDQLERAKEKLEGMKGAVSIPDIPELKQLHDNLEELRPTLGELRKGVAKHQEEIEQERRAASPEYKALDALFKGIEQEKERLIMKYMGEAMHKFYGQAKDNQDPAQQSRLQATYNSFHKLEDQYQLQLHGPDDEIKAFRGRFKTEEASSEEPAIYDLIDPRLKHLEKLSQCVERHRSKLLTSKDPRTVIEKMKKDLNTALLPENIQELSEKRRGKLVQFITNLARVFLPSRLLQTKTQRNLTEITQKFKQQLEINRGTEKKRSFRNQIKCLATPLERPY